MTAPSKTPSFHFLLLRAFLLGRALGRSGGALEELWVVPSSVMDASCVFISDPLGVAVNLGGNLNNSRHLGPATGRVLREATKRRPAHGDVMRYFKRAGTRCFTLQNICSSYMLT